MLAYFAVSRLMVGRVVENVFHISCLQMILFFFCDADMEQILHVRMLLLCFQAVANLKVNVQKSEMVLLGEINNVHALTKILGCKIGT